MPEPEFLLCSRKPAIGDGWFNKFFAKDVFPHGRVITAQGTPAPVPTFYKRKLRAMNLILSRQLSTRISQNANNTSDEVARSRLEDSPARRAARSVYAKARTSAFTRDIKG